MAGFMDGGFADAWEVRRFFKHARKSEHPKRGWARQPINLRD
jgi:hypothetical protein